MLDLFAYWAQPPPPNVNDKWCSTMSPLSWPRQFNSNYHFLHRSLHSVLTWRLLRSENENFLERDRTAGDWCGQLEDDECPQTHFCPTLSSLAQLCPAVGTFLCPKYHLKMIGGPAWTNPTTALWVKSTYLHIFLRFSGVLKFCSWVSSPAGNLVCENLHREMQNFKVVSSKPNNCTMYMWSPAWHKCSYAVCQCGSAPRWPIDRQLPWQSPASCPQPPFHAQNDWQLGEGHAGQQFGKTKIFSQSDV